MSERVPFSAVLLAGGRSTRMGQDKAALRVGKQPLWLRQLALLQRTGAEDVFISGPLNGAYRDSGVRVVSDAVPGLGPLAGIVAALGQARHELVLVLAVDLPRMTAGFLRELADQALADGRTVIPKGASWYEPLAAVYHRDLLALAETHLAMADRSLQRLLKTAESRGMITVRPLRPEEAGLFANLNQPGDLGTVEGGVYSGFHSNEAPNRKL